MARLSPAEQRQRRAFDYEVVRRLASPALGAVEAFATEEDMRRGRALSDARGREGDARCYAVEFRFRHLVGPGPTAERALACISLDAGGNYPFDAPLVQFPQAPRPYNPHVHPAHGGVCLGPGWKESGGRMLLAQLVVHVMRLVNFDEPAPRDGLNGGALSYARDVLGSAPYLADLPYPALPAELTHRAACRARPTEGGFVVVRMQSPGRDDEGAVFRPVRGVR